jgi:hypothetical protein
MYHFTALVTCLAIAFYFSTSIQVSGDFPGVAPSMEHQHPRFEPAP